MKVAVGIATRGRPDLAAELPADLRQQTQASDPVHPAKVADRPTGARTPATRKFLL